MNWQVALQLLVITAALTASHAKHVASAAAFIITLVLAASASAQSSCPVALTESHGSAASDLDVELNELAHYFVVASTLQEGPDKALALQTYKTKLRELKEATGEDLSARVKSLALSKLKKSEDQSARDSEARAKSTAEMASFLRRFTEFEKILDNKTVKSNLLVAPGAVVFDAHDGLHAYDTVTKATRPLLRSPEHRDVGFLTHDLKSAYEVIGHSQIAIRSLAPNGNLTSVWEPEKKGAVKRLFTKSSPKDWGPKESLLVLKSSMDERTFVAATSEGRILVFDQGSGRLQHEIIPHHGPLNKVQFSNSGRYASFLWKGGSSATQARVVDLQTGNTIDVPSMVLNQIIVDELNGRIIALPDSMIDRAQIREFDLASGQEVKAREFSQKVDTREFVLQQGSRLFFLASEQQVPKGFKWRILTYDLSQNKFVRELKLPMITGAPQLAAMNHSSYIAISAAEPLPTTLMRDPVERGQLFLMDADTGEVVAERITSQPLQKLTFTADDDLLIGHTRLGDVIGIR